MKLPHGEQAQLSTKLGAYSLNSAHRQGQHKARVFESALGITLANKEILENFLLEAAARSEDFVSKGNNGFGESFTLRLKLTTEKGSAIIMSAWIILNNESFPRLTTCFIV